MRSISLYQQFAHGIKWNAIEAIPYQLLLTVHQMAVFSCIGSKAYGLVGTLFSLIFLIVGVTSLGFDTALPSFFAQAITSKRQFLRNVGGHYLPTVIALGVSLFLIPYYLPVPLTPGMLMLIMFLVSVESTKKGLRTILHGAFYNKQTALIELFQIVTYTALVWGLFMHGVPLNVELIFGALACVPTLCTGALVYYVYHFYCSLPDKNCAVLPQQPVRLVVQQRCYTTLTTLGHQFFSGNALVPLFAYRFGLSAAGTLKIICTIAHSASLCIQKIFGSASDALFAHLKYSQLHDKQQAFSVITRNVYSALFGIIIFGTFAICSLYASHASIRSDSGLICALLFLVIHVSEQFFSTYERFFITENCSRELALFNSITLGILYGAAYYTPTIAPILLLQRVVCIRLISFAAVCYMAFIWWRIRPSLHINPLYLVSSLALSLVFFLFAR